MTTTGMYQQIVENKSGTLCNFSFCPTGFTRTFDSARDDRAAFWMQVSVVLSDLPLTLRVEIRSPTRVIDSSAWNTITKSESNVGEWAFTYQIGLAGVESGEVIQVLVYNEDKVIATEYFAVDAYPVRLRVDGIPQGYTVDYFVDGEMKGSLGPDERAYFALETGSRHNVTIQSFVEISNDERLACLNCQKEVASEFDLSFRLLKQFLVKITTDPEGVSVPDLSSEQWVTSGASFSLKLPEIVNGTSGTRYLFQGWREQGTAKTASSIQIKKPTTVVAVFKTQFYVDVVSEFGEPKGSGWYDSGANVTVSVPKEFAASGYLDTLGFRWVFSGWSWNAQGQPPTSSEGSITVNSPVRLEAKWALQPNQRGLLLIGIIVAAVVGAVGFAVLRRRAGRAKQAQQFVQIPPPEAPSATAPSLETVTPEVPSGEKEWKYCINCGAKIPRIAKFCVECGSTQPTG